MAKWIWCKQPDAKCRGVIKHIYISVMRGRKNYHKGGNEEIRCF